MFTRSSLGFWACGMLAAWAQPAPAPSLVKVNFPSDSPVTVVSADWGDSRSEARGGALVLDLHTSLQLRNSSSQRIRGITLLVQAQEVTPGGKASVSVPSLDIKPAETFPVRVDLRLLRPLVTRGGPLVQVELDGVLFEDLSFFGPNRLNSQRAMTIWELEARRDRKHFRSILEARGAEGLRNEIVQSLAQQAEHPRLDVQVSRRVTVAAAGGDVEHQFAFLRMPEAPLEPLAGSVRVRGNEAYAPRFEVRNRSARSIRYFEIGWVIRDRQGHEFLAESLPASGGNVQLGPGQKTAVQENTSLRFSQLPGKPLEIESMTGFVTQVEFADGSLWIPPRSPVGWAPSPEEQRLTELYRKRGLSALVNELKRF